MKQSSDRLYVGQRLTAEDISRAKSQGLAAIVNIRPDDKEAGQLSAAENRSVAEGKQLAYARIPGVSRETGEARFGRFRRLSPKMTDRCWRTASPGCAPESSTP